MLPKSRLLEFLIENANALKKNDGKKALSANYFVISLLQVIAAMDKGQLPEQLAGDDVKAELEAARALIGKYGINSVAVIEAITKAIGAPEYKSSMDEVLFGKLNYSADAMAKKKDKSVVDTTVYLELIFAEPTAAIKTYILGNTSDEANSNKEELNINNVQNETLNFKRPKEHAPKDKEEQDKPKEKEPERKDIANVQDLAKIVEQTQNIQKTLLENIFGQDYAVNSFASGYFQSQLMASSRKETKKPKAMFLFAGPPGVGKTFLAEKAAEALGLPFRRFDMSEYSDHEASIEFCGSDSVYKNGKGGNVTTFVAENPKCVLLFDEIEKAHISIIYLFLQILDAGHIRDNYTDKVVSFSDATIIFTTNVGKKLYENSTTNLSSIPRKKIIKALETELNPATGAPLFPSAICSRFASGNVIMFNHLEANNLYTIAKRELQTNVKGFEATAGIKINIDDSVPSAIMFSEGGKADARTVKGRANAFFHEEMYELFRLLAANNSVDTIKEINISVPTEGLDKSVLSMFESPGTPEVLVFAGDEMVSECERKLKGKVICHFANSIEAAKDVLFNHDISVVLCDVEYGKKEDVDVLNVEDVSSLGRDFLTYVLERYSLPVYILQAKEGDITQEEFLSFAKLGIMDVITVKSHGNELAKQVISKCEIAYQQGNMMKLARENKALLYKTAQTVSKNKKVAKINLFDFRFSLITDVDDSKSIVDSVSRPDLGFDDVIGAEDAKQELKYFVEYLKNPIKYMRKGVRSPKGVLLYGPPGTGKTLLAKAMAGESGVTFLKAEGNEFLKRYIGEGPEAVHALFNSARKYAPAIVFIDEIDAIGKAREASDNTGRADVLTALLTEMDGFNTDTSKPVFVLAATNYGVDAEKGNSLDAALLRRFDRRIYVDLPNKEERKKYLKMKLAKYASVQLSEEQIDNIAMRSTGMSLAELESIFEMALRSAIRSESGIVGDAEFEEAFETFNSGEKKEWNPDTLTRVARHEAGHALICWLSGEKPSYLTVVARGDHGGYMQHANSEGKGIYTKVELLGKIRTSLGGRASEIVYYGDEDGISTGASGDLYSATRIAEQMICNYGMDQSVGMSYIDAGAISGAVNQAIRDKVNAILEQELNNAINIIKANKKAIDTMVDTLMERNHLNEKEIDDIFKATVVSTEIN